MSAINVPSTVFLTFLVYLASLSGDFVSARSHHHHQHHHHLSGINSNSGPASLRNREEAGALPFTESRYPTSSDSETINTRSIIGPRYPAENIKAEGFPAPRSAYQQQQQPQLQRQQQPIFNKANFQPFNNNNNQQQQQPNFYARAPQQNAPLNAPKEKPAAGGSEAGKWSSNHTIPFLKKLMGEVDEGKIKHHDYPAMTWFLKYFAEQYPDITRLYSIGMILYSVFYHIENCSVSLYCYPISLVL